MLTRLMRRLRDLFRRASRLERELDDELRSHVEHRTDDLIRAGLDPAEARRRARIELGAAEAFKDEIRGGRPLAAIRQLPGALLQDLRLAARRLRQAPLFTLFAILTLGLGIGAVTAAYSGMYALFLRPRGFETDGLVVVNRTNAVNPSYPTRIAGADFDDLTAQQQSLETPVAWMSVRRLPLAAPSVTQLVEVEAVSGGYFHTLGVPAAVGRPVQPSDDEPGSPAVAVLSDAAWRRLFDADPSVIGTTTRIGGQPVEIVGVAPPGFRGATAYSVGQVAAWVPLASAPRLAPYLTTLFDPGNRTRGSLVVAGRLERGATVEAAAAELATIGRRLDQTAPLPPRQSADAAVQAVPVTRAWSAIRYDEIEASAGGAEVMRIVVALPLLVLLVACTNLTNLFLSRGATRRQEFAVRAALGASRLQLIRAEMAEAVVVGAAGAALGAGVAHALLVWVTNVLAEPLSVLAPQSPFEWRFDPVLFAATGAAGLVAMVLAGLVPAVRLTRPAASRALNTEPLTAMPRWRGRSNLIALQVGVSVALFLITAVSVRFIVFPPNRSLSHVRGLDGLVMGVLPFGDHQTDEATARDTLRRAVARVRRAPGVDAAGIINGLPELRFGASGENGGVARPDRPFGRFPNDGGVYGHVIVATPEALPVARVELLSGRLFDDGDAAGAPHVVLVSAEIARQLFGAESPLDRPVQLRVGRDQPLTTATVIGVVGRRGIVAPGADESIWVPFAQQYVPTMGILVRASREDLRPIVAAVTDAVRRAAPDLAVQPVGRAEVLANGPLVFLGFMATSAGGLGTLALVLTMTGLYGVLSHVVSRRRREMGLRLALGADRRDILRLILLGGFRPVAEGLFIGLASAWVLRQVFQMEFTSELSPIDLAMFGSAAVPLVVAAAVACYLPARSAARVDPNVALRDL